MGTFLLVVPYLHLLSLRDVKEILKEFLPVEAFIEIGPDPDLNTLVDYLFGFT